MTTGASTSFETTAKIISASATSGNNGPQWKVQCKFPWTYETYEDSVYLDQSAFPEAPASGIYRVEVAFKSLKNKKEGGKHSGTHYWMNNYYITRIGGVANQMNPLPDLHSIIPGMENTAAANSDTFTGNAGGAPTPTANGNNGGHYDPNAPYNLYADRNYGQIKGNCNNILMALESKLPGMWDETGNPDFAMWIYWRDEIYNRFQAVDITVYAEDNEADDVLVPPMEVNEAPAAPVPPAPAVQEHHCEKHNVGFNKYNNNYMHKMGGTKDTYCHEGIEGLFEGATGNPVTEQGE